MGMKIVTKGGGNETVATSRAGVDV
jgi:hypothetical protein